ncbi:Putative protein [Zobellia galactanivorans]|uniref:Uncharacterized protein n=1 Tax=Zobellia galactanivorans (strain DSM 12802 / CCUG 47099 / CIP 106680 / NCIMB 13871 / Dsij) TaxID=63186 RepID=G0L8E4_ZOBGA|nr:Putative protein [Zobellia galactanivorans]
MQYQINLQKTGKGQSLGREGFLPNFSKGHAPLKGHFA